MPRSWKPGGGCGRFALGRLSGVRGLAESGKGLRGMVWREAASSLELRGSALSAKR